MKLINRISYHLGHFCPVGTQYEKQYPCKSGTYNPNEHSTKDSSCIACPSGSYCTIGAVRPTLCPKGFYCPVNTTSGAEFPCHHGTYSNKAGLKVSTGCRDCPSGHFCPYGSRTRPSIQPTPCPPGTYNPNKTSENLYNCLLCKAGRSCPESGLNESIGECKPGYYCPLGTIVNTQFPCQPGTYTNATDLKASEDCTVCPPSFTCGWATGFPIHPWQPCKVGHFCPEGIYLLLFFIDIFLVT